MQCLTRHRVTCSYSNGPRPGADTLAYERPFVVAQHCLIQPSDHLQCCRPDCRPSVSNGSGEFSYDIRVVDITAHSFHSLYECVSDTPFSIRYEGNTGAH